MQLQLEPSVSVCEPAPVGGDEMPIGELSPGDVLRPSGPDALRIARIQEHSFLAAPISRGSTVVDLGMNTGQFATTLLSVFGCSVVGVEPAPLLFDQIPKIAGLTAEQAAVTVDGRSAEFFLSENPLAGTTDERLSRLSGPRAGTIEVAGTTLAEILDRHCLEHTPLVKVDIEGGEIAMLDNASLETLQRVDQFTIEFHDFLSADQTADVERVKKRLRAAGFAQIMFSSNNQDVLFVNRSRVPFTRLHECAVRLRYKYPRGMTRILSRRMPRLANACASLAAGG